MSYRIREDVERFISEDVPVQEWEHPAEILLYLMDRNKISQAQAIRVRRAIYDMVAHLDQKISYDENPDAANAAFHAREVLTAELQHTPLHAVDAAQRDYCARTKNGGFTLEGSKAVQSETKKKCLGIVQEICFGKQGLPEK